MLDSKRELCIAYHNKELTTDVGYKGIAVVATSQYAASQTKHNHDAAEY